MVKFHWGVSATNGASLSTKVGVNTPSKTWVDICALNPTPSPTPGFLKLQEHRFRIPQGRVKRYKITLVGPEHN